MQQSAVVPDVVLGRLRTIAVPLLRPVGCYPDVRRRYPF